MKNTFPSEQIAKTGDLNDDLIMKQYRLDKMAKFMEFKTNNPRLTQSEKARELEISSSTVQRYTREINMLSPHRIPPTSNINTRKQKTSDHSKHDLKKTSNEPVEYKKKN